MRAVKSADTRLELDLRCHLRTAGLSGYRLHVGSLPGRPDICYTRWKVAVFVDGCFWHGCPECGLIPTTNVQYWQPKLQRTAQRDTHATQSLKDLGYSVLRFWEHDLVRNIDSCVDSIEAALVESGRPANRSTDNKKGTGVESSGPS